MKAKEIKKTMLAQYKNLISSYEYDIGALEGKRNRIRLVEVDLQNYFGIEECYRFDFK